jgi:transcriptional regulator with XRE-family HTH domain
MANALREWRTARGWTLADVGGLTGLTVSYLSLIERGLRDPTPQVKIAIARRVGARVGELFPPEREQASA